MGDKRNEKADQLAKKKASSEWFLIFNSNFKYTKHFIWNNTVEKPNHAFTKEVIRVINQNGALCTERVLTWPELKNLFLSLST